MPLYDYFQTTTGTYLYSPHQASFERGYNEMKLKDISEHISFLKSQMQEQVLKGHMLVFLSF